jgi:ethanolamine utilization protein EutP (predicted NTPase)
MLKTLHNGRCREKLFTALFTTVVAIDTVIGVIFKFDLSSNWRDFLPPFGVVGCIRD